MIDRKTEAAIKAVGSFLEFWTQFHAIYEELSRQEAISPADEAKYFAARDAIAKKYAELAGALDLKYAPRGRSSDPVSDVLAFESVRFASEKMIRKLEADWQDSYVFLNNIVERLKSKKRRLGQFSPIGVYFKRLFERKRPGGGLVP